MSDELDVMTLTDGEYRVYMNGRLIAICKKMDEFKKDSEESEEETRRLVREVKGAIIAVGKQVGESTARSDDRHDQNEVVVAAMRRDMSWWRKLAAATGGLAIAFAIPWAIWVTKEILSKS